MLIVKFITNDLGFAKLGRRGISLSEIEQMRRNGAVVVRNPRAREAGSRLVIGRTYGGRMLTVVAVPSPFDSAIWHVRTAWESSTRERRLYYRGD